ncbi:MAG: hypothetical protein JWP01_3085 [Myxococcales bacterium]|nr:hypothetical protein [Myxococcales bacterium]
MRILVGLALVTLATTPVGAETKADKLFKKGKKLLGEKKYADACEAFEQVDKLDPGIGAKLNVARCFEEWGRLAVAYRWYSDAEKMAAESKDDRAAKIKELAEELDTNVPRVTIKVPADADPAIVATVTLDGKPFPANQVGIEQRVDPGPHLIEFTLDGKKKRKMAPVERGGSSEISLDIPKDDGRPKPRPGMPAKPPTGEPEEPDEPATPGRTQRIVGASLAATGGIAVGVAVALTLGARSKYKDAIDAHCMGSTSMCDDQGLQITGDARSRANLATIISIGGGAAILGGVVLYLIAPRAAESTENALYLTPTVGPDGGGLVFGGRY